MFNDVSPVQITTTMTIHRGSAIVLVAVIEMDQGVAAAAVVVVVWAAVVI